MSKWIFLSVIITLIISSCSSGEVSEPFIRVTTLDSLNIEDGDTVHLVTNEYEELYVVSNFGNTVNGRTEIIFNPMDSTTNDIIFESTGRTEGAYYEERFKIIIDGNKLDIQSNYTFEIVISQMSSDYNSTMTIIIKIR